MLLVKFQAEVETRGFKEVNKKFDNEEVNKKFDNEELKMTMDMRMKIRW
ncbi:hypothetical protein PP707_05630 [Acetobacter pasteurianus]|nr:hypothetical protein [Acetobacter pasteurianus]